VRAPLPAGEAADSPLRQMGWPPKGPPVFAKVFRPSKTLDFVIFVIIFWMIWLGLVI
jgi:hypothetical protein